MILVFGDVHGQFKGMTKVISDVNKEWPLIAVVQVGDFGVFKECLPDTPKIKIPIYFVEGNHEDFSLLTWLRKNKTGIAPIKKNIFHIPRGATFELGERKWVGLGGSEFFSAPNCPRGSTFTDEEVQSALVHGETDILITHDAPIGLGIPGHPAFGGGIDVGTKRLLPLYGLKPKLWLFGHHHQRVEKEEKGVKHFGLDCVDFGYALLNPRTLQIAWRGYNNSQP